MKWKNVPPVLLIVIPLLMVLPFFCSLFRFDQVTMWLFTYTTMPVFAAFPVVMALNVLCAYFLPQETEDLARWNLRIKLFLIPVYLFVAFFAMGVPLAVPFLFLFDALLLLTSSGYGFRAVVRAEKEGQISKTLCFLLFLCHFCFVLDVVAAFVLHRKLKTIAIAQNL